MGHSQEAVTHMVLCVLDMRENVHYTLERLPSITRALANNNVTYLNIYNFEKEFGDYCGPDRVNQNFVDYLDANNIKTIFTSSEIFNFVSVDTITHLIGKGIVISSVLGDDENNYHININYLGLLTIPVAYQKTEYSKYLTVNPNTYCLPISTSMYGTESMRNLVKTQDVIFIGKAYGIRPELLKYLSKNGVNIVVYGGSDWGKHFDDGIYKGYIKNSDYYEQIAKSKITLALLESPRNVELLHVNAKPFDAAKTGTALIVTRYKTFFQDYGLEEKNDLYAYSCKEELLASVKHLLKNNEARELIATNLSRKIRSDYDYDDLYRDFFKTLLNQKSSMPEVKPARVFYASGKERLLNCQIEKYDYIIFKKKGVVYSDSIKHVLAGHVQSNHFVKLDSCYKGKIARKVFDYIDIASLAIPVNRLSEVKVFFGLVKVRKGSGSQAFLPLNRYEMFNIYVSLLLALRAIYQRFN